MRRRFSISLVLMASALMVSVAVWAWADEVGGSAGRKPVSGEIRFVESSDRGAAKEPDVAVPAKPKKTAPTPVKRKPRDDAAGAADASAKASKDDAPAKIAPLAERLKQERESDKAETASEPPKKTANRVSDDPLEPIPDSFTDDPATIEASSFKGVTPGRSTRDEVDQAWGKPKQSPSKDDPSATVYAVEPFETVEVRFSGGKVASIVIFMDRSFPVDVAMKQLGLSSVSPAPVANEMGEILGLSFPERGVLFAFEPSKEPGEDSSMVKQIVLEPITAEPFVLRAETYLQLQPQRSMRDLEQALRLDPKNARAHWLRSRMLSATRHYGPSVDSAAEAVRYEPDNPQYRVTLAQSLAQAGRLDEAIVEVRKAVAASDSRPYLKARALCILGDLLASGSKPDYKKAIAHHTQAIQLADPFANDPHPAVRVEAKEVLVDAHLGAAHDIAWGEWKEKEKAVARWLERAAAVADDLVRVEDGSREILFRVHCRTLAAYVGIRGDYDPNPAAKAAVAAGDALIASAADPSHKAQLQSELGMALYDALQIRQMQSDHAGALQFGEKAVPYLSEAHKAGAPSVTSTLLGRLYYRLGAIQAIQNADHRAAVAWFDKAVPLLDRPETEDAAFDRGRHGEAFIGMGVSYWETGQRSKAVELTQRGIQWMEQAVRQGTLDQSALAIPYNNLAAMHRQLGSADKAKEFQEMAGRVKKEKLK